ncbi:hypothetical protein [Hyalangium minutum]|uniref:Uncharacterized protein n=1 Tax=Hyalangium minutum TaxID=394096 RepID=A0A085VZG3_9BACT|nr:hypothetical protein DB31_4739 [Hyalangium minutum]
MQSLVCPRCGATHEISGRKPGEAFPCSCGAPLVVPTPARRGWGRRWALILGALMLPCLLVGGGGVLLYLKRMQELEKSADNAFRTEAKAGSDLGTEARVNVIALCDAVQMYRSESGQFLSAGPTPKEVPKGGQPVPFPADEAFQKLGFAPGTAVRFQYQVVVKEDPVGEPEVTCYARGDQDGDGQNSVYSVTLDVNGMTSPVQVEREDE